MIIETLIMIIFIYLMDLLAYQLVLLTRPHCPLPPSPQHPRTSHKTLNNYNIYTDTPIFCFIFIPNSNSTRTIILDDSTQ